MINASRIVSVTSIIYLVFILSYASGAIHAFVEGGNSSSQVLLVPDRRVQTLTESVLLTLIFFLGLAGFYFVHGSARPQIGKQQKAYFIAGFSIIGISLLGTFLLVGFKLG